MNPDISTKYDLLSTANKEVALEKLPKRIKRSDPISDREEVQTARCVLKKASEAHYIRPTRGSLNRLEATKSALDNAYNKAIDEELRSKAEELKSAHEENRHIAAWAALRELTNKRASPVIKIDGVDSKDRPNSLFHDHHVSSLLGKPEQHPVDLSEPLYSNKVSDQLAINTNPFSIAELQVCLRRISNSKTAGPNYIPALMWKNYHFQYQLLEFCNKTFIGNKSTAFSESYFQPSPKKGNLRLLENYRGIA